VRGLAAAEKGISRLLDALQARIQSDRGLTHLDDLLRLYSRTTRFILLSDSLPDAAP
jgi:hypothetical protein